MESRLRASLTALTFLTIALAGCTDDGDGGSDASALTEADCEAQGLVLGVEESMMDNETSEPRAACVEPGPPATVTIQGLSSTGAVYSPLTFQWVLDTPQEESHAMRTEVRYDMAPIADADLAKPDDWGTSAALREHQNFVAGQSYDGSFTPEEPGTYYFRAYALVSQTNIWSDEFVVEVGLPAPTGVTHTVTATGSDIPGVGTLDPEELTIQVGDAIAWVAGSPDPDTYTITSTNGPASFTATSGGAEVVLTTPGSYTYDVVGTLGDNTGLFSASGSINVVVPSADGADGEETA